MTDSTISRAALVTGCSSGIGRATAERLAASGWTVYATARKPETLSDLEARGCRTLALDVTDEASMRAAVEAIESEHGAVGVLVNNAGYSQSGAIETVPMDKVRDQFETNVFGLVRLCQLVLPGMRRQRWGKIVNLSSMGGKLVFPGGGFYHATKYAVEAISDALRFEVKGFGVDVILIEPGLIRTAFGETASGGVAEASPGEGDYAQFNAHVARATESVYEKGSPVGRLGGPPEAVAKVIAEGAERAPSARPLHGHALGEAADGPARAAPRPRVGRRHALPVPAAGQMSDVARLAERAARDGRFGIDTEFMPEGRYKPLLCLVQVCVGGEIAVLDPFEGFDPAPFAEVLADPGVQVVLHAGRQDVAIMRREWRTEVTNVFDTQVAAGFAGLRGAGRLHGAAARRAEDPRRQDRELHALGRAAADPGAGQLREGGRRAPAAAGRRDPEAPALQGPARVGARGVPRDRRLERRARPRGGLAAAAARRPGWTRASARSRASWAPGASARR